MWFLGLIQEIFSNKNNSRLCLWVRKNVNPNCVIIESPDLCRAFSGNVYRDRSEDSLDSSPDDDNNDNDK
ncbi:9498_t:CDS:2, partial [Entrophospora sp. SA101]